MAQTLRFALLAVAAGVLTPACASPIRPAEPADEAREPAARKPGKLVTNASIPINQQFRTLDEYLAFRKKRGAVDDAWYREIRPGVYQLESGNYRGPAAEKRTFTREELMRKYGFSR